MKLEKLIAEAKQDEAPVKDVDWGAMESRLMNQIEAEKPGVEPIPLPLTRLEWRRKYLRPASLALAIAATFVIYMRRDAAEHPIATTNAPDSKPVAALRAEASNLTSGDLLVNEKPADRVIRTGDALSLNGGRAMLEQPKAVSWLMETVDSSAARARVSAAGDRDHGKARPLVLDLEHGAIEAQVTPVSSGEAFAIDLVSKTGIVRVAVHGTHLRVLRDGDHVSVDLSEGVIAIGVPPTDGDVTTGTTVIAPAHVELEANDLGSITVKHTGVREPVQLGDHVVVMKHAEDPAPVAVATNVAAPQLEAPKGPIPTKIDPPKPAVPPKDAILSAVRECAVKHAAPGAVRVTVTSDLSLTLNADGSVKLAQFTPPLPPDVQTCATETIYKQTFESSSASADLVHVPIEFSY
jgi:hypothetical protein